MSYKNLADEHLDDWSETRERKGCQLAYPWEEKRFATWDNFGYIQNKLEGERCIVDYYEHMHKKKPILLSSTEKEIISVPHINLQIQGWMDSHPSTEWKQFDGELYEHRRPWDGEDGIHAIVSRTVNLHADFESIGLHLFDIKDKEEIQFSRLYELEESTVTQCKNIHRVEHQICKSPEQAYGFLDNAMFNGYEGFVIRNAGAKYIEAPTRSRFMMKFKPHQTDIWRIVGSVEEVSKEGTPKGTLGALTCQTDDDETFNVKANLTDAQKKHWWYLRDRLDSGELFAKLSYQRLSSGRRVPLCHFKVEIQTAQGENII